MGRQVLALGKGRALGFGGRSAYGGGSDCATRSIWAGGTRAHTARISSGSLRHSAIGTARPYAPSSTAAATVAGVVVSSRSVGSNRSDSSSE